MSAEENKETIRQFVEQYINNKNLGASDQFFAPNYVAHNVFSGAMPSSERQKDLQAMIGTAVPDRQFIIEDIVAEDDQVVIRGTHRGTHSGQVGDVPPSGKAVSWSGVSIVRMVDGKAEESWHYGNFLAVMQVLGIPYANT